MFNIFELIHFIKKNISKRDLLIGGGLIVLFIITRIVVLNGFPIFSDEGIYIHWSKIAWHDATWRFISLTDGRQPLQTWLTIPFLKIFHTDLLTGGRMFGVASGFFALSGLFSLATYVFNKRTGYIAAFLYIITPFYVFFDRLAMIDSMVNAAAIWTFFFSIILIRTLRLDVSLIFGFASGIFLLAKSNTSMFLALSVFAPVLTFKNRLKLDGKKIVNYVFLYVLVAGIAFLLYNIQRLSPFFHFVGGKNNTFVLTVSEFLQNPFQVFWYNLPRIPLYTAHNLGWATFIFGIIGFVLLLKKDKALALYMSLWVVLPYIFMSFFMRVLFSRYHIFLLFFFIICASYFFSTFAKKLIKPLFIVLLMASYAFTIYFSYTILFDYKHIPFLETDRGQYIEGWPAGWGAKEIMQFAAEKGKDKPVIILAEGNFGMTGDVLDVFKRDDDNISIRGSWPLGEKELTDAKVELKDHYVYAVFAHKDEYPANWPIKLIHKYEKPGNKSAIYLFEVVSR